MAVLSAGRCQQKQQQKPPRQVQSGSLTSARNSRSLACFTCLSACFAGIFLAIITRTEACVVLPLLLLLVIEQQVAGQVRLAVASSWVGCPIARVGAFSYTKTICSRSLCLRQLLVEQALIRLFYNLESAPNWDSFKLAWGAQEECVKIAWVWLKWNWKSRQRSQLHQVSSFQLSPPSL